MKSSVTPSITEIAPDTYRVSVPLPAFVSAVTS